MSILRLSRITIVDSGMHFCGIPSQKAIQNISMLNRGKEEFGMKEKNKQIIIYLAVAYGLTYLMGLLMWYGHSKGYDLNPFPIAQMIYPAAGVSIGLLVLNKGKKNIPTPFLITVIATAAICMLIAIVSVLVPLDPIDLSAVTGTENTVSIYYTVSQLVLVGGSFMGIIFFFTASKEKREEAGLNWKNTSKSILLILLFFVLYMIRIVLNLLVGGIQTGDVAGVFTEWLSVFENPLVWITFVTLPISFVQAYIAFFGEEYGWRFYFQPYLQNRFGMRAGIFVLGVVWGLWHLPIDLFYYTQTTPIQMAVAQIVTCISISIFFGYAYLKTENIWVPVIMHFMNNNLIPIISGDLSAQVLENQSVSWLDIPISLAINGVIFWFFIFSPVFNKKEK